MQLAAALIYKRKTNRFKFNTSIRCHQGEHAQQTGHDDERSLLLIEPLKEKQKNSAKSWKKASAHSPDR